MKQTGFAPILILVGIVIITTVAAGAYFFGKTSVKVPASKPQVTASPTPQQTNLPFPVSNETAGWKTYQGETSYTYDGSTKFEIRYPAKWERKGDVLYPLGRNPDQGIESRIILGAAANGSNLFETKEKRKFPAGIAGYRWSEQGEMIRMASGVANFDRDNVSYIFVAMNIPLSESRKYEDIFNQILSTFKFID